MGEPEHEICQPGCDEEHQHDFGKCEECGSPLQGCPECDGDSGGPGTICPKPGCLNNSTCCGC